MSCALSAFVLLRRTMADGRAASHKAAVMWAWKPRAALANSLALGYYLSPPSGGLIQRLCRIILNLSSSCRVKWLEILLNAEHVSNRKVRPTGTFSPPTGLGESLAILEVKPG